MGLSARVREWLGVHGLERRLTRQDVLLHEMMRATETGLADAHETLSRLQTTLDDSLAAARVLDGTLQSFDQTQQRQTELITKFARLSRLVRDTVHDAAEPVPGAAQHVQAAVRQAVDAEPNWDRRFEAAALCEAAIHAACGDDPRSQAITELIDDLARRYIDEHADTWGNVPFKIAIRERTEPSTRMRRCLSRYLRTYRDQVVVQAVQQGLLVPGRTLERALRFAIGLDERTVELPLAFDFAALHTPGRVLDAGAALNVPVFRSLLPRLESSVVHVTFTAATEPPLFDRHHYSYVFSDLRQLEFRDGTFDRALCLSTLEHVGMDNTRYGGSKEADPRSWATAAREIVRVVKPGGQVLITVPYGDPVDHRWYHTFGPGDVGRLTSLPGVARVDSRYFFYDRGWYEGSADDRVPQPNPEAVTALAVMRLTRT